MQGRKTNKTQGNRGGICQVIIARRKAKQSACPYDTVNLLFHFLRPLPIPIPTTIIFLRIVASTRPLSWKKECPLVPQL